MTDFLASVAGPAEALLALRHGADIIDVIDPADPAGPVCPSLIGETVAAIAGRRPVSAVAMPLEPSHLAATVRNIAATGVDYIRIGILGGAPLSDVRDLAAAAAGVKLIAVLFADAGPDLTLLPLIAGAGFTGAMLDTQRKPRHLLLDQFDVPRLQGFVQACQAAGLLSGLAGSLETPDIPRLLLLRPDLLAFRAALCGHGGRNGALAAECVQTVRALIPPNDQARTHDDVDYRLLAARGYAPSATVPVDRITVEDLVLPVSIGAYAREREARQRVRFTVEASVTRSPRAAEDMRDVFSYDLITDGIQLLIDAGHFALVETLAERIADLVLAHNRVVKVAVRVEKLDTGPASVGVSIERTRSLQATTGQTTFPLLTDASRAL